MKVSPARAAAFDVLARVERERAFTSVLLPQYEENLSGADRGLCHELVLGTLRKQLWLDRLIDKLSGGKKLDLEVRIALRLGLYQLLSLQKVPAYSAIHESVNLVQRARKTSAKGIVNAILRRSTRETIELQFADDIERISIQHSHPRWLIERWSSLIGTEQAERLAATNDQPPPVAFRIIDHERPGLDQALSSSIASNYVDGCYLAAGNTGDLRELGSAGAIYFQDEGSQLVASSVAVAGHGRFLDVCAAPGGKTAMIAASQEPPAFSVAGDFYHRRVEHLRDNCLAQGAEHIAFVQYDAAGALPFAGGTFDAILLDAPCSGTGTIRHNPEIRYFLAPDDPKHLAEKQLSMLLTSLDLLRPGGQLVYSTCSLERDENEEVCARILVERPEIEKVRPNVHQHLITDEGYARTWPHRDNMDGFFIAAFQKSR